MGRRRGGFGEERRGAVTSDTSAHCYATRVPSMSNNSPVISLQCVCVCVCVCMSEGGAGKREGAV